MVDATDFLRRDLTLAEAGRMQEPRREAFGCGSMTERIDFFLLAEAAKIFGRRDLTIDD